jgi:hypothetical protein
MPWSYLPFIGSLVTAVPEDSKKERVRWRVRRFLWAFAETHWFGWQRPEFRLG